MFADEPAKFSNVIDFTGLSQGDPAAHNQVVLTDIQIPKVGEAHMVSEGGIHGSILHQKGKLVYKLKPDIHIKRALELGVFKLKINVLNEQPMFESDTLID